MDHLEVGRYWDANAPAWTKLSRLGYDIYRDAMNTPAFLAMLPPVNGLTGLDVGCGEGANTRLLARHAARMVGVDVSRVFLTHAQQTDSDAPEPIRYVCASAFELPLADRSFDFVTALMSLMDMPDQPRALAEVFRVLRPGGFLQFSICHPCFISPRYQWVLDAAGRRTAMSCADYFREIRGEIDEWTFSAAPEALRAAVPPFQVPRFHLTLSHWLNALLEAGFVLERFCEPAPSDEALRAHPSLYDARIIAYTLLVRARKPG